MRGRLNPAIHRWFRDRLFGMIEPYAKLVDSLHAFQRTSMYSLRGHSSLATLTTDQRPSIEATKEGLR